MRLSHVDAALVRSGGQDAVRPIAYKKKHTWGCRKSGYKGRPRNQLYVQTAPRVSSMRI